MESGESEGDHLRCLAKDAGYEHEDAMLEIADPPTADQYEEE